MKESSNHRKGVLVGVIVALLLVVTLGVTFAIYNYSKVGENQILVTGDIYMKYTGTNQINAPDMLPIDINKYYGGYIVNSNMTEEELSSCENYFNELNETLGGMIFQEGETAKAFCEGTGTIFGETTFQQALDTNFFDGSPVNLDELKKLNIIKQDTSKIKEKISYFEFKIEGVNKYSKDIWYEIVLKDGDPPADEPTRTERLRDDLLRFRLVEVVGKEEKEIFTNRGYEDISDEKIYVNTIGANTTEKITRTYRLYMWISDSVKVGVGDNIDYDMETWNDKVYASVKINVAGDFVEKEVNYTQPAYCFMTQEFNNNGKTEIMVTDYDTDCGTDVVIPSKINGHEVTVIGSQYKDNNEPYIQPMAFSEDKYSMSFYNKGLTSVVIPNTVRTIGGHAFSNNYLTKVEIPDSVELIDAYAFYYNQLKTLKLGNKVQTIGYSAFEGNKLTKVEIPDSVELIDAYSFTNNSQLKAVEVGNEIKYIGYAAFSSYNQSGANGILEKLQVKKACEEIKNIPASPTDLENKYYPFVGDIASPSGLDVYGYEDGSYKLCEHLTRNS